MKWLLLVILLLIISIVILLFVTALKIRLFFDTDISVFNITFLWLSPIIKASIKLEGTSPILYFYLFDKQIFRKEIKKGKSKKKNANILQVVNTEDLHVNVRYGFADPFKTGITCGAINAASQFINIDSIKQTPDFITDNDYIYLDASAKINLGSTIINYVKSKSTK